MLVDVRRQPVEALQGRGTGANRVPCRLSLACECNAVYRSGGEDRIVVQTRGPLARTPKMSIIWPKVLTTSLFRSSLRFDPWTCTR